MSSSSNKRQKTSRGVTILTAPAALPPSPVPSVSFRLRRLFWGAVTLVAAAIVLGGLVVVSRQEKKNQDVLPAPAFVQASFQPKAQAEEEIPSDEGGITLPVESRDTEVKTEEFSETAPSPKKKTALKTEKATKIKVVVKAPDARLTEAAAALEAGAWKKALSLYGKILKKEKKNAQALEGRVFALEKIGSEGALDLLESMEREYPHYAPLYAARARILAQKNDMMEAIHLWERAVALDPGNKDYRLGLAVSNDRLGREEEAFKHYRLLPEPLPADTRERMNHLARRIRAKE